MRNYIVEATEVTALNEKDSDFPMYEELAVPLLLEVLKRLDVLIELVRTEHSVSTQSDTHV